MRHTRTHTHTQAHTCTQMKYRFCSLKLGNHLKENNKLLPIGKNASQLLNVPKTAWFFSLRKKIKGLERQKQLILFFKLPKLGPKEACIFGLDVVWSECEVRIKEQFSLASQKWCLKGLKEFWKKSPFLFVKPRGRLFPFPFLKHYFYFKIKHRCRKTHRTDALLRESF